MGLQVATMAAGISARDAPAIAAQLSCNLKHLSTDPLSGGGQSDASAWPKRLKLPAGSLQETWIFLLS